jgi:hypothetical protein
MTRKDAPQVFLDQAKAQTGAALALAKARLLIVAYTPEIPSKREVIDALETVIEDLTPRGGQRPRLVFRPALDPGKRASRQLAGTE